MNMKQQVGLGIVGVGGLIGVGSYLVNACWKSECAVIPGLAWAIAGILVVGIIIYAWGITEYEEATKTE